MELFLPFILFALPAVHLLAAVCIGWGKKRVGTIAALATITSFLLFVLLTVQLLLLQGDSNAALESSVAWLSGANSSSGPNVMWGYRFDTTNLPFILTAIVSTGFLILRNLKLQKTISVSLLFLLQSILISALMASDMIQFCVCSELSVVLVFLLLREPESSRTQTRPFVVLQFLASNFILAGCLGLIILMATFEAGATSSLSVRSFSISSLTNGIPETTYKNGLAEVSWNQVAPFLCFFVLGGCLIRGGVFPLHHWLEAIWENSNEDALQIFFGSMTVLSFFTWFQIGQPLFATEFNLLSTLILWLGAIGYFWCALIYSSGTLFRKLAFLGFANSSLGWIGLATQNEIADWGVIILVMTQVVALGLVPLFVENKKSHQWVIWFFIIMLIPAKATILYGMLFSNPTTTTGVCLLIVLAESLIFWRNYSEFEKKVVYLKSND